MATALPPQSRQSNALRNTAGWPTQSKAHVTPPSGNNAPAADSRSAGTSSRTVAAASPALASTKWVAPNWRPRSSFAATVSTATMRVAPEMRRPWITFSPTPPTPNTAAVSPGFALARLSTAPTPVRTPQPIRQADVSGMSFGMRTACTSLTIVVSEKTEAAAKLEAGSPLNVNGVEMFPSELLHHVGCPVLHARHAPQLARVAMTTWSPGFTDRTASPTDPPTPA